LVVFPIDSGRLECKAGMALTLCARRGGERFQRQVGGRPRSLKKHFQEAAVPEWQRKAPLVFRGDDLLFVPGLGLDARIVAPLGTLQVGLRWEAC
jgi:tRNA(Ile)-lysidine synthase